MHLKVVYNYLHITYIYDITSALEGSTMKSRNILNVLRILFLAGVMFNIGMAQPIALACTVHLPPGNWTCACDAGCACVCVQGY